MQSYALPGSTARQLFNSSTLLDSSTARHRSRQNSTDLDTPALPRRMQSASTCLDGLDSYSKELLDSYSTGSTGKALTAPRQWPRAAGSTKPRKSLATARQLDSQGSRRYSPLKLSMLVVAEHLVGPIWISVIQLARRLFCVRYVQHPFLLRSRPVRCRGADLVIISHSLHLPPRSR